MTKLYIGNIPTDTREEELDDAFAKFGKIESVWLARNPPGIYFSYIQRLLVETNGNSI